MDLIRSAYITKMRFYKDSLVEIPVLWYRADANAKVFPFYHCFASRIWDATPDYDRGQVGEVPGAARPWNAGINPGVYNGQDFFGEPGWFIEGAPLSAVGTGRTTCYFKSDICSCSRITSEDQTNYTRDAAWCSCASIESAAIIDYVYEAAWCSCSSIESAAIIGYVYEAAWCSCSSFSSLAIGPYYLTSSPCSCGEFTSSLVWHAASDCSCSSFSSARNILTGLICSCGTITSSRTWTPASSCSCSTFTATHTP